MRRASIVLPALVLVFAILERHAHADELCSASSVASLLPATLRMKELGEALATRIDACSTDERRADGERFWKAHAVEATPARLRDYARTRTLFEMTRDGGPWRLRWAITNREPSAKKIWEAWQAHPPAEAEVLATRSVTAECDELSALFAGLARRVGVRGIGLFWPTKNHTIAAWEAAPGVRVLVPTTQIYAACEDTFDHAPFSPGAQKTVFEFPASDTPDAMPVSRSLATFLLDQVTYYAGASLELLGAIRIHRALAIGSSVRGLCRESMVTSAKTLRGVPLTTRDQRALVRYGTTELGMTDASATDVLERLIGAP